MHTFSDFLPLFPALLNKFDQPLVIGRRPHFFALRVIGGFHYIFHRVDSAPALLALRSVALR